jgi:hypothetical protein
MDFDYLLSKLTRMRVLYFTIELIFGWSWYAAKNKSAVTRPAKKKIESSAEALWVYHYPIYTLRVYLSFPPKEKTLQTNLASDCESKMHRLVKI